MTAKAGIQERIDAVKSAMRCILEAQDFHDKSVLTHSLTADQKTSFRMINDNLNAAFDGFKAQLNDLRLVRNEADRIKDISDHWGDEINDLSVKE